MGNREKGRGGAKYRGGEIERELGISGTYYFRTTKEVFKAEIMHEIGYHYEVLDKAKGNFDIIGELYVYMCKRYWIS